MHIYKNVTDNKNNIDGVMISVLATSVVNRGSGRIKPKSILNRYLLLLC